MEDLSSFNGIGMDYENIEGCINEFILEDTLNRFIDEISAEDMDYWKAQYQKLVYIMSRHEFSNFE